MKHLPAHALLLLGLSISLFAVEKQYQSATILKVEQKTNTRILYYIVNTPITKDEPYYEVSLRLTDTIYVARYTPRHHDDTLPEEWGAGSSVQARVNGRHLFIKRPSGTDVDLVITKRKAVTATDNNPQNAPADK